MTYWGWIIVGLVLLVGEISTSSGFFLLFFGLSSLLVGLLSYLNILTSPNMQWVVFMALAVISCVVLYKNRGVFGVKKGKDDTDSLVGVRGKTMESIAPAAVGKVEVRGSAWNARNVGTTPIASGAEFEVVHVDGLTLSIK